MAVTVIAQRTGKMLKMFSESDADQILVYPENKPLKITITGARKARSYRELCCYKGSCKYIANLDLNEDMNTQRKVDHMTKVRCNFVDDIIYDDRAKRTHWLVRSLSYTNCDHPESHAFIARALEMHTNLAGLGSVDEYVKLLNEQK